MRQLTFAAVVLLVAAPVYAQKLLVREGKTCVLESVKNDLGITYPKGFKDQCVQVWIDLGRAKKESASEDELMARYRVILSRPVVDEILAASYDPGSLGYFKHQIVERGLPPSQWDSDGASSASRPATPSE